MPRGQPRLSFRELTARSQEAAELHSAGLSYRKIAAKMRVHRMTAWRWVHWRDDMIAAWGFIPRNRARRLPFRHGLGWDQERFDRLVADRAKVVEAMAAQEAIDKAERIQRDAARAARSAERDRRAEGIYFVENGSEPPAWLVDALIESLFPPKDYLPGSQTPPPP